MALWIAVHGITDNELVAAETVNRPIYELAERTNYLYENVQALIGSGIFESVRLASAALSTGANEPVVKDVVYLNPDTGTFEKATAAISTTDAFVAALSSFGVGILVSKTGTTGYVALYGKMLLSTAGTAWTLTDLLESGEAFRAGPYYLSSIEPGKLTAYPAGPMVYMGYFTDTYALLNPQYRDTGEAHVHRAYALKAQPAGRQVVSGTDIDDTHSVIGFSPAVVDELDIQPRLVALGGWTGGAETQYTIWLSDVDGTAAPTDFSDLYVHWASNDGTEGSGKVRVSSFESSFAVGTKGLVCALENPYGANWDTPYDATYGGDSISKRTWVVSAPEGCMGWRARKYRQTFGAAHTDTNGYTFRLTGGPLSTTDARTADAFTIKCSDIFSLSMAAEPSAGDTTAIGDFTYEYTDGGDVTAGNIAVELTGTIEGTYRNLLAAILATDTSVTPVLDLATPRFLVGAPGATTITHLGSPISAVSGAGSLLTASELLVFDQDNVSLVSAVDGGYWHNPAYWTPLTLTNGLSITPVPYTSAGLAAASDDIDTTMSWTCDVLDEAPGANFVYAVAMHTGLAQYYPPVPFTAATVVLNGVELDSQDLFPSSPTYKIGIGGLYWYSNAYGLVPWSRDWESPDSAGSDVFKQNMLLHFVRPQTRATGYVTSLRPRTGSLLQIYQCGTTTPATSGDLEIGMELSMGIEDANLAGYQVVKDASGSTFKRGPVVEKIVAGNGIAITQSAGAPSGQGVVVVSLASSSTYTGDFEEVALQNAKEEIVGMFPYIRLLPWTTGGALNVPTGFICKFRVPHTIPDVVYRVLVYATVFGEADIAYSVDPQVKYAGLTFNYSILPDYLPIGSYGATTNLRDALQPAVARTVAIPFGDITVSAPTNVYSAYDPILVHNNADEAGGANVQNVKAFVLGSPLPSIDDFPTWTDGESTLGVRPGTLVGVQFQRANVTTPASEYTSGLGFINLRWALVPV